MPKLPLIGEHPYNRGNEAFVGVGVAYGEKAKK